MSAFRLLPFLSLALCLTTGCFGEPEVEEFEGDAPGECSDDADNDQDGLFDCDDDDCEGSDDCDETSDEEGSDDDTGA